MDENALNNMRLLIAAGEGNRTDVEKLVESKADKKYKDGEGNTPIHWAASNRNATDVLKYFLKSEEDLVLIENSKHQTPLDCAQSSNNEDGVKLISAALHDKASGLVRMYLHDNEKWQLSDDEFNTVLNVLCEQVPKSELSSESKKFPSHDFRIGDEIFHVALRTENVAGGKAAILVTKNLIAKSKDKTNQKFDTKMSMLLKLLKILESVDQKQSFERIVQQPVDVNNEAHLLRNILNEKRERDIILRGLEKLLHERSEENARESFTYSDAFTFLNFLETFSFENVDERQSKDVQRSTAIVNDYVKRCFPGKRSQHAPSNKNSKNVDQENSSQRDYLKDIKKARNYLIKREFLIHSPKDLMKFVAGGTDLKKFFGNLRNFTRFILKITKEELRKNLFAKTYQLQQDTQEYETFLKSFLEDITNVIGKKKGGSDPELMEKIRFNLILNVLPTYTYFGGGKPHHLHLLRNKSLHQIQTFDFMTDRDAKEYLQESIVDVYKWWLASKFHDILNSVRPATIDLESSLSSALRKANKLFKNCTFIRGAKESSDPFSAQGDSDNVKKPEKPSWDDYIPKYLQYLAPILDQTGAWISTDMEEEIDDKNAPVGDALSIEDKWEIFSTFLCWEKDSQREGDLQNCLSRHFRYDPAKAKSIIEDAKKLTVEPDNPICKEVQSTVKLLKEVKSIFALRSANISPQEAFLCYKAYTKDELELKSMITSNHSWTSSQKEDIKRVITSLPDGKASRRLYQDENKSILLNISSIVMNLLQIFELRFRHSKLKMTSIEEALNDKSVLQHLVYYDKKHLTDEIEELKKKKEEANQRAGKNRSKLKGKKIQKEKEDGMKVMKGEKGKQGVGLETTDDTESEDRCIITHHEDKDQQTQDELEQSSDARVRCRVEDTLAVKFRCVSKSAWSAPYCSMLVLITNHTNFVSQDDLKNMLMKLMNVQSPFLEDLLKVNDDRLKEEVSKILFKQDKLTLETTAKLVLRNQPDILKVCKHHVNSNRAFVSQLNDLYIVANDVVLTLINEDHLDTAQLLSEIILEIPSMEAVQSISPSIIQEAKLNQSKLHLRRGGHNRRLMISAPAQECYRKALESLQHLEKAEIRDCQKLLMLSRRGFSHSMIAKSLSLEWKASTDRASLPSDIHDTIKFHKENAFEDRKTLWAEFCQYVTANSLGSTPSYEELSKRVNEFSSYHSLLRCGYEYKKYLRCSKIYADLAYQEYHYLIGTKKTHLPENLAEINEIAIKWQNIYHSEKSNFKDHDKILIISILRRRVSIHKHLHQISLTPRPEIYHKAKALELQIISLEYIKDHCGSFHPTYQNALRGLPALKKYLSKRTNSSKDHGGQKDSKLNSGQDRARLGSAPLNLKYGLQTKRLKQCTKLRGQQNVAPRDSHSGSPPRPTKSRERKETMQAPPPPSVPTSNKFECLSETSK